MIGGFKYLVLIVAFLGLTLLSPVSTQAFDFFSNAKNPNSACNSPNAGSSPVCKTPLNPNNPITNAIHITISVLALIAGVLAVFMIIISGFTLITSGGNQEAVANSRKRITSAVIGLIIVALSWTIISFILDKLIK